MLIIHSNLSLLILPNPPLFFHAHFHPHLSSISRRREGNGKINIHLFNTAYSI